MKGGGEIFEEAGKIVVQPVDRQPRDLGDAAGYARGPLREESRFAEAGGRRHHRQLSRRRGIQGMQQPRSLNKGVAQMGRLELRLYQHLVLGCCFGAFNKRAVRRGGNGRAESTRRRSRFVVAYPFRRCGTEAAAVISARLDDTHASCR
ncbi:MAG: hypothetical protein E5X77_30360 [Mesorhizobium sp.]|nr:MAG: hypothetical protein E5X77_30360 [Mesorhizobium sp.]